MRNRRLAFNMSLAAGLFIGLPAATAQAAESVTFQAPSGNIACVIASDGSGAGLVRCDIGTFTYVPTAAPADCHVKYGHTLEISRTDGVGFSCAHDTMIGSSYSVLNYGQTIRNGSIECSSDVSGITCTDTSTRHYFYVSRQDYRMG
ncbi:DUF6636 domain-containing protein [Nocardia sp. NPDC051030]|uniref:DUF6636 domain-containing protein n=1 Tax=Nocardia sp. NPDC051030 TaxID=3155162 RepID=UPI003415DC9B